MKKEKLKKVLVVLLCLVMCVSLTACGKPSSGTGTSTKKATRTITYDKLKGTAKLNNVTVHDEISGKTKTITGTVTVQNWASSQIVISYKTVTYSVAITTSKDKQYITMNYNSEKYKVKEKK